jgi:hypothetical protein
MSAESDFLQQQVNEQVAVYRACDTTALRGIRRTLVQAWLSEVGLNVQRLQKDLVQLSSTTPSQVGLKQAWARYWQVFTALSPVSERWRSAADSPDPAKLASAVADGLTSVANRLLIVLIFLSGQIVVAITLLVFVVRLFGSFDPETTLSRQQWNARGPARTQIHRVRVLIENAGREPAPVPAPPSNAAPPTAASGADVTALRGEVEGLAAALAGFGLATADVRTANAWLDETLADLDREPPDYAAAASALGQLETILGVQEGNAPPSLVTMAVLGSLLGMITITIHLNWKYRNRWDTVGFLPWYVTKLIGAPVISLSAIGLLAQVTFTKDFSNATGLPDLGLLGASPLLLFAVAILTGLFSNRVFDWLRSLADTATSATTAPAAAPNPTTGPADDGT